MEDFTERYNKLCIDVNSHVKNLRDSVPLWEHFNSNTQDLFQWLEYVNSELESDRLQPGNVTITKVSLGNAEVRLHTCLADLCVAGFFKAYSGTSE